MQPGMPGKKKQVGAQAFATKVGMPGMLDLKFNARHAGHEN